MTIHHRKALVGGLGVQVITETELVGQFVSKGSIAVTVGTAEHECCKKFFAHILVGSGQFRLGRF